MTRPGSPARERGRRAGDAADPLEVDFLARLASSGPALQVALGTGRVAIPLVARGLRVTGINLSRPMLDKPRRNIPEHQLPVVERDMATTRVESLFSLAYAVGNSIGNVRPQAEQVEVFRNAARHLVPGGRFVIELWIPGLRRLPPGQSAGPFDVSDRHVGFDTYDLMTQQGTSHQWSVAQTRSVEGATLVEALTNTFLRRGTPVPTSLPTGLSPDFFEDAARQRQWAGFLRRVAPVGPSVEHSAQQP